MISCTSPDRPVESSRDADDDGTSTTDEGCRALVAVHIAVVDPLPLFQQGVATVLSAEGHAVEVPADVVDWARKPGSRVVLLTIRSEADWGMLLRLGGTAGEHKIIAILDEPSAIAGARAVRAGATSVLPRDVTFERLRRTVEATASGQAVMPAEVAMALAGESRSVEKALTHEQLSWLRLLAAGTTVEQLAQRAGYSERAMYRLLRRLYGELGVRTRLDAIMRAQALGWL
jgi:DNA-binding NarL/FixJ family response regulator